MGLRVGVRVWRCEGGVEGVRVRLEVRVGLRVWRCEDDS